MSVPQKQSVYVGRTYHYLTVLSTERDKCKCQCVCGAITIVPKRNLRSGNTKSCGCWLVSGKQFKIHIEVRALHRIAKYKEKKIRHPRLYEAWKNIIKRCSNPNHQLYKWYGARGIQICSEWRNDFFAFQHWARTHGYRRGLEIDRANNDAGYSPDNCRWVTRKENCQNKRPPCRKKRVVI